MSRTPCPAADELIRYVDSDLPPERSQRMVAHLNRCQSCREEVDELQTIARDIHGQEPIGFSVTDHVQEVLRAIEQPTPRRRQVRAVPWLMATGALAASVALFVCGVGSKPESLPSGWQARGSSKSASLTRDVGVRIFKLVPDPCPLKEAEVLDPNTAFTVGVRNLGRNVGHALVFAIDAHDEVHWIAPAFTQPETDPVSITIERLPNEQLLPTSVVFDDMAMGPLRVLSIVGSNSMHVSEIERLALNELALEELKRRFSSADVRELIVSVKATGNRQSD